MTAIVTLRSRALLVVAAVTSIMALSATVATAQSEPTPLGEETGPLAAGTYVDTSTGPSVVFTVDEGWEVTGEPLPGVGTELTPTGFDGAITLTTFDGNVFGQPCAVKGRVDKLLKNTEAIDPTAESFIGAMAAHRSLAAQGPAETELAGMAALQLDVVSLPDKKCDPRTAFLWELPIVREYHVNNGTIARLIAADVGNETVVVVIEIPAKTSASPFAFLDRAMELVDTIEITPANQ